MNSMRTGILCSWHIVGNQLIFARWSCCCSSVAKSCPSLCTRRVLFIESVLCSRPHALCYGRCESLYDGLWLLGAHQAVGKEMRANNIKHDGKCQMNELDNNMRSLPRKERPEKAQMVSVGSVGKVSLELDIRRGKCLKSVKELEGCCRWGVYLLQWFADKTLSPSSAEATRGLWLMPQLPPWAWCYPQIKCSGAFLVSWSPPGWASCMSLAFSSNDQCEHSGFSGAGLQGWGYFRNWAASFSQRVHTTQTH